MVCIWPVRFLQTVPKEATCWIGNREEPSPECLANFCDIQSCEFFVCFFSKRLILQMQFIS